MKVPLFLSILFGLFAIGALTYCFMNNIIIIKNFNTPRAEYAIAESFRKQKKYITLYFFKNGTLKQESESIVLTNNQQENCMAIINRWLSILVDESITPFRINLQSACYDHSGTKLIISFEQSIFSSCDSVAKKLMHLESLLKTIRENIKEVQEIYLLVHHQPLQDPHIDTIRPWPIHGFTQSS